jgi:hypothetical protein
MSAIRVSPYSYEQADAAFFDRVNIPLQEVDRQRGLLTAERPFRTHADRACTVPDGILRIEGESRTKYITKGREAIQQGRLTDFVPASGAATRMFADLLEARKAGSESLSRVPDIANYDAF